MKVKHIIARKNLGCQIRTICDKKGMTLRQLSYMASIDPANLTRICDGRYGASIDVYERIFNCLGYSLQPTELIFDC